MERHISKIDTSPIAKANAQGLAVSHEPGVIHVDVAKIFNAAKKSLPPAPTGGQKQDMNALNAVVVQISQWIEGELTETAAHESAHVQDYIGSMQKNQPFASEEHPAEQFGQQTRKRFFPQEQNPV
jgi:hypothetical protein